jgi:hypothetical protein
MKYKYRFLFFFILLILIFVLVVSFLQKKFILFEIDKFPENDNIIQEIVQQGEIIKTSYRHSIATTTVWEVYKVTEEASLIQTETHFYDSVAGMPYAAFGDEIFLMENGKYKIINMNRPISLPLRYNIGAIRENHLYLKDKKINLSKITGDQLVTMNLKKMSLWERFLDENM